MNRKVSRVTAFSLVLAMMVSLAPHALGANGAESPAEKISLEAAGPTITVHADETQLPAHLDPFAGTGDMVFTIARDYEQDVWIPLGNNTSSDSTAYYMTVDNAEAYPDLSMNFVAYRTQEDDAVGVQGGYEGNPGVVLGGYSASSYSCGALLKIFAQEAEGTSYDIDVTFHNLNDSTTSSKTIQVNVSGEGMKLSYALDTSAEDGSVTVALTNEGEDINSMNIEVDDDFAAYAYLPRLIHNFPLESGSSVEFTVAPTAQLVGSQGGKIIVKDNGDTFEIPVTLTAPEPETITGEELAKNISAFGQLAVDLPSVTSGAGDTTISFAMESSKAESDPISGTVTIVTTPLTEEKMDPAELAAYGYAEDDAYAMEDGSVMWIDDDHSGVVGDTLTIKLYQLFPQGGTVAVLEADEEVSTLAEDPAAAILQEFELEIDLSGYAAEDVLSEYSIAIEGDTDLKTLNNAPLPPKTKKNLIAYRQMELLLQKVQTDGGAELKQAFADAFNAGLPEEGKRTFKQILDSFTAYLDAAMEKADLERDKIVLPFVPKDDPTPSPQPDRGEQDTDDWSYVQIDEDGYQCTNRGKISSSFHTKDTLGSGRAARAANTAASKGIRVFYTGRITSEDKYINFQPITYALYIQTAQGGKQSIGTSVNTGLSELNIIELDPTMIPMGEKITFTRDYDVNPGSHFVNTDNRFTIVYPADAVVPVDASKVQLAVPDFDVYKKNIFLLDADGNYVNTGIVGENKLHVSISNRGARGGYYQLSIQGTKSGALIDDQTTGVYRYLPAFTTEVLELPVTLSAGTESISVKVTDCSQRTKETDTSNNTASYTISTREREVPAITSVTPADASVVSTLTTALRANLSAPLDVTGVTITLQDSDGGTVCAEHIPGGGSVYSTDPVTLTEGKTYTLQVQVTYLTGGILDASPATLTKTTTFTTPTNGTWATITLPAGTTLGDAPEILLYSYSSYSNYYSEYTAKTCAVSQEDGSTVLTVLGDGTGLAGKLLTLYDPTGYALYAGWIEEKDTPIDMTTRRTLALDGATFESDYISVSGPRYSPTRTVAVSADKKSVSLPNIPVYVNGALQIDGISYRLDKQLTDADFNAEGTYTFAAEGEDSSIKKFTFTVSEYTSYRVYYVYKYRVGSSYYNSHSLSTRVSGTTLTAITDLEGYEPFLFICANSYGQEELPAVYVIPVDEYTADMDLTALETHTVTFTAEDMDLLHIQSVQVMGDWDDYPSMYTWGTAVQCTPGQYTVAVSYTYDGLSYSLNKDVDLTTGDQTINLTESLDTMAQLDVSWDAALQNVNLWLYDAEGTPYDFSVYGGETSGTFRIPAGTYHGSASCYQDGVSCSFELPELTLTTAAPTTLHLSATWTGKLQISDDLGDDEYTANQYVPISIIDVQDADENAVQSCYGMTGYVIFESDGNTVVRQVYISNSFNAYSSVSVQLPGEPGTYTIRLSLENPLSGDYTITAAAGTGGTITPHGSVAVNQGDDVSFTIMPNGGYVVQSVLVDGTDVGACNSYTFESVTADHTIEATFAAVTVPPAEDTQVYTIVAEAGVGGTISPEGMVKVNEGEQATFLIQPDEDYAIQSVKVDGRSIGARDSFTFTNVTENHTIEASFRHVDRVYGFESYLGFVGDMSKIWSVTVDETAHGTITASKTLAVKGDTVKLTAVPADGYVLESIQVVRAKGSELPCRELAENTYTFTMPNQAVVVKASFVAIPDESVEEPAAEPVAEVVTNPFADVFEVDWFCKDVLFAYENGLFRGVSDTTFAPNDIMSRAMFVTVLSRTEALVNGTPIPAYVNTFLDVPEGQWYTDAVAWAAKMQIAAGYGEGTFGKDDNVTREQACTFIVRYLTACGVDLSAYGQQEVTFQEVTFTDAEQISAWAQQNVAIAQALGIIKGRDDGRFDPAANMTRAECAAVFHRLMEFLQQK